MLFNGLLDLSLLQYVVMTLLLTHVTIVAVTVFLHRHQAHRALVLHPLLSHFFRFWLWLTTGMVTREWVAIHRKHHAKCEMEEDPHSPQVKGLSTVLWRGSELYRDAAADRQTIDKYGGGCPDDWLEKNLYGRFSLLGIVILAIVQFILFGAAGIAVWAVQMLWIPFWAAGVVNGIGHYWGYRNFEIPNAATNIVPWGILIGGEELHNNHHAYGSSAKLSSRWWEFDLGWLYIRLFTLLGLAKVRKIAPKPSLIDERPQLDMDTIRAVTVNRLQLYSDYARTVLAPVFREEIRNAKKPWRRIYRYALRLAKREVSLLDFQEQARLREALDSSSALQTVYQFKVRLQAIWEQQASSHEKRLLALKQWCAQAEASGIGSLEAFVHRIRRYELSPGH